VVISKKIIIKTNKKHYKSSYPTKIMFKKFKEKLKSWIGKSKEKIVKTAPKAEKEEKETEEERLEIIDENENIIGEESREKIHEEGLLHREIHVWVYNNKEEILFQKRAPDKDTFPNLFDASAGGHVDIGEDYVSSALRELEEETGINAKKENLVLIGEFKKKTHDKSTNKTNYAIRKIYAYYFKGKKEELSLEKNKATKLKFWPIKTLFNLSKEEEKEFIPTLFSEEYIGFYKKIENLAKEKPKKQIIEEEPNLKPEEQGTAIKIEQKIEEQIPQEEIDRELKKTEKPTKKSLFSKIKSSFSYKISEKDFKDIFNDLEMLFLENNVALEVVEDIEKKLSEKLIGKEIKKNDLEQEIKQELKNTLNEILIEPDNPLDIIKEKKQLEHKPFVVLFFGINGTGKTTSIAKIAYLLQKNNLSVVLAAADTFRAASIEQIQIHADKLKIPLIKQDYGADPSAIGFDAIRYAEKHKIDVVLIDTAGRMHTKTNLLAEMDKICRITKPDLKIFVAESIAGNDATEQAKTFNEIIKIDGSILSKADIDEKGGTIISVSHATHKPIFYLGVGQGIGDLKLFDKQEFIENLGL